MKTRAVACCLVLLVPLVASCSDRQAPAIDQAAATELATAEPLVTTPSW